jgi:hypothetical protein
MRQTKRLTLEQFALAVQGLDVSEKTRRIAESVLVHGRAQVDVAAELDLSKGAISQAVDRVWKAAQRQAPDGLERVTVTLPHHQARIVREWEKEAMEKRGPKS